MDKVMDLGPAVRHVCANCKYQESEQMQGQIMRQLVCHRMPPTISMVATPQGIQGMTMFPVVQPQMWCHEWQSRDVRREPLLLGDQTGGESTTPFVEHVRRTVPVRGEPNYCKGCELGWDFDSDLGVHQDPNSPDTEVCSRLRR